MSYATVQDLANAATNGWDELAQRASSSAAMDAALLRAACTGASLAEWPADMQTLGTEAAARVADALDKASYHADTYLYPRYRAQLPLPAPVVAASSLPAAVAAIALRRLYGATVPDDLRKGTQWADDYLRDLSKGVVSLGGLDTEIAAAPGRMATKAATKAFDWAGY